MQTQSEVSIPTIKWLLISFILISFYLYLCWRIQSSPATDTPHNLRSNSSSSFLSPSWVQACSLPYRVWRLPYRDLKTQWLSLPDATDWIKFPAGGGRSRCKELRDQKEQAAYCPVKRRWEIVRCRFFWIGSRQVKTKQIEMCAAATHALLIPQKEQHIFSEMLMFSIASVNHRSSSKTSLSLEDSSFAKVTTPVWVMGAVCTQPHCW